MVVCRKGLSFYDFPALSCANMNHSLTPPPPLPKRMAPTLDRDDFNSSAMLK